MARVARVVNTAKKARNSELPRTNEMAGKD